jgi:hypothetical protein
MSRAALYSAASGGVAVRRPIFAASLAVTVFALLSTVPLAIAGPPEAVSGRMVLDPVEGGLWACRMEKDTTKRTRLLEKLAETRDPRVGVFLGEVLERHRDGLELRAEAARLLAYHYGAMGPHWIGGFGELLIKPVSEWWDKNEAELRRRAALLAR